MRGLRIFSVQFYANQFKKFWNDDFMYDYMNIHCCNFKGIYTRSNNKKKKKTIKVKLRTLIVD